MAQKDPNRADVFKAGEALPFLQGKEQTKSADVFVRGEALPVLEATSAATVTGSSSLTLVLDIASAGVRTTFGASTTPIVFSIASAGTRTALGSSSLTLAFGIAAAGTRTTFGSASLSLTFGIASAGDGTTPSTDLCFLLDEDGVSRFLLEDGSGDIALETCVPAEIFIGGAPPRRRPQLVPPRPIHIKIRPARIYVRAIAPRLRITEPRAVPASQPPLRRRVLRVPHDRASHKRARELQELLVLNELLKG